MSKGLRAVIVDDSDADVLELVFLLREAGYAPETRLVPDAVELKRVLGDERPDIVISGFGACARSCRAAMDAINSSGERVPFVVASTALTAAEAATLARDGAAACAGPDRLPAAVVAALREAAFLGQREAALNGMREAAAKYRDIFVNALEGIFQTTPSGRIIDANPALARIFGFASPRDMIARVRDLGVELYVDAERREEYLRRLHQRDRISDFETRMRRNDGEIIWVSIRARTVRDEDGHVLFHEGSIEDVTERKMAVEELSQAKARYKAIFEHSVEGIFQTTPDGRYLRANPALARIYGYGSPDDLLGGLTDIARQLYVMPGRREEFKRLIDRDGVLSNFESEIFRRDGEIIWISENARAVRDDDGAVIFYEGAVMDITERKKNEELLRHQAFHDALTGLPNRALFQERLDRSLKRRQRREDFCFAVLFLDLDRFKVVNDSLGHIFGDRLLVEIAARLESCVRNVDTVSRFGGDEFAVLLEDIPDILAARRVIERIQEELDKPFCLGSHQVFTGASIGVVLRAQEYERPEHIIRDADIAMYRAKSLGKSRYEIFDACMRQQASSLLKMETDLRRAIERKEFRVHYQPIVCLRSGSVTKLEALVRWNHPEMGLILPGEFIPVAEETGLIVPIGEWVLRSACETLRRWIDVYGDRAPAVSVNLSAKQFLKRDLAPFIAGLLRQVGVPARLLELEITESRIMENAEFAAKALRQLKELGVRISIDDFGTGYSSLAYLHSFPIDSVKIDRSFVSRMTTDRDKAQIVETIVSLAHGLGLDVVAEGVEQDEQRARLGAVSCEFGQGFLFSRPIAGEAVDDFLRLVLGKNRVVVA